MKRVTFSRNYTISLSRTCQCYCKYCSFATHLAHLYLPDEVTAQLDDATRRGSKELLILTGERPEVNAEVAGRLKSYGFDDFTGYVVWVCEQALERGILPHSNLGVLDERDLTRLRDVNASMGLMLESSSERLMETVHAGSPTKHPSVRIETIDTAGRLKIPFTSGILVGIGETEDERARSLEMIADSHRRYGHIQEVILQNFVPHSNYYGRDVSEIADRAGRAKVNRPVVAQPSPDWASPVTQDDLTRLIQECRRLMPEVGIQVPPNLSPWWIDLVRAGATDLGGLSSNGDHISPEHPFPTPHNVRKSLQAAGSALTERLCVYPQYIDQEWLAQSVLDVVKLKYWSFIPRRKSRVRQEVAASGSVVAKAIEKSRDGTVLNREEVTALFSENRAGPIEDMRSAADELRSKLAGELVTYVVNRNINISNICTVGCAFCGFGQGKRSPDAYHLSEEEFAGKVEDAVAYGATEICIQSGIHPDYLLSDYGKWLKLAKEIAPEIHLHAYSPMEVDWMCERSGRSPEGVFEYLRECGLGSVPGTAAEVLHDGVRNRISPNKLPVARWVEIVEAAHLIGLRSTVTVMFGHIETPAELAEHMHIVHKLQTRTEGFTEFVPLSFIPYQTLLGRTHGIEEITHDENLKHTAAFRLALGRSIPNLQASWVKMGLELAVESLRWGVNDLGGTLMEESISKMAGSSHGTKLDPEDLIGAAHAAGRPAAQRDTLYRVIEPQTVPEKAIASPA